MTEAKRRPSGRRGGANGFVGHSEDNVDQPSLFDDVPATAENALAGRDRAGRNADDWWTATAMQAVRAMAATGRVFQAYDLVETYGLAEPPHRNRWGALLTRAARDEVIVAVGAAPSRRPTTARSLTRTWRGTERPAAGVAR